MIRRALILSVALTWAALAARDLRPNRYICATCPTPKGQGVHIFKHGRPVNAHCIPCVDVAPEWRGADCAGNYSMMPAWARGFALPDPLEAEWRWIQDKYESNPSPGWRWAYARQQGQLYLNDNPARIRDAETRKFFIRCREEFLHDRR